MLQDVMHVTFWMGKAIGQRTHQWRREGFDLEETWVNNEVVLASPFFLVAED